MRIPARIESCAQAPSQAQCSAESALVRHPHLPPSVSIYILPLSTSSPPPPLATVLQGNDTTFGEKLRKEAGWHPRFSFDARAPGTDFCIHHSSGSVVYSCAAMLDKNRDTLSQGE